MSTSTCKMSLFDAFKTNSLRAFTEKEKFNICALHGDIDVHVK